MDALGPAWLGASAIRLGKSSTRLPGLSTHSRDTPKISPVPANGSIVRTQSRWPLQFFLPLFTTAFLPCLIVAWVSPNLNGQETTTDHDPVPRHSFGLAHNEPNSRHCSHRRLRPDESSSPK